MIELYIENKKIDITDDLEINFTYETIDPDKLSSIKNSFSKTVNIPGTQNNNYVFGYIFRYDKYLSQYNTGKIENDYDPHKKVNWFINKNGSLINRGYCTLDNIIVKNDYEYTYQLTFYGGLGEFFYNLTYNEDGTEKTLYDLYWNWFTYLTLREDSIESGSPTTPEDENDKLLYNALASLVAGAYSKLDPYILSNARTNIENDIVFVPCYTGNYEDFDSKAMLVNTGNQNNTVVGNTKVITDNVKNLLMRSFPDSFSQDDKTYTTLSKDFDTNGERYGLVKFSRDLDPFEAGELRVNEMPYAIRLSKLMEVISNPINNGGYEVEWDESIKLSPYWLYSFVLMNKLKKEKNDVIGYDIETPPLDGAENDVFYNYSIRDVNSYNYQNQELYSGDVEQGNYVFNMNYDLTIKIQVGDGYLNSDYKDKFNSMRRQVLGDSALFHSNTYNIFIIITRFYSPVVTDITNVADVFFIQNDTSDSHVYGSNYGSDEQINLLKPQLSRYLSSMGISDVTEISEVNVHKIKTTDITYSGSSPVTITSKYLNQNLNHQFELKNYGNGFKIQQFQCVGFHYSYFVRWDSDEAFHVYGLDSVANRYDIGFWTVPPFDGDDRTLWWYNSNNDKYSFSIKMNTEGQNRIYLSKSAGYTQLKLYKKDLFANSQSPMKYLSGFCKLMNYRFICDNTEKKIYIKELKNYYVNKVYDLTNRIDLGKDINIKNVTSNYKNINIGLDTVDTYPVHIFNKTSKDKFNIHRYSTNIEYPLPDTELLNDLIFQNTIDWQENSIFYNIFPQFPKAYNTTTISWNLFYKESNTDNIQSAQQFTLGAPSNAVTSLLSSPDWFPKNSLFNKENKMEDFDASLVFLNGFVKNYDYVKVDQNWSENWLEQYPITVEDGTIDEQGNFVASSTQKRYKYNLSTQYSNFITVNYADTSYATDNSYAVNYYDENMNFLGGEYTKAEIYAAGGFNKVELTNIISNTYYIIVSYDNSDSNKGLFWKQEPFGYIISPRLILSNDNYEQYYLNQQRCYQYDFNYSTAHFRKWGYGGTTSDNTSATSWVLPMFTKDLYNIYSTGSNYEIILPYEQQNNMYVSTEGQIEANPNFEIFKYNISSDVNYKFSGSYSTGFTGIAVAYYDSNETFISSEIVVSSTQTEFTDVELNIPNNATKLFINVQKINSDSFIIKQLTENLGWTPSPYKIASWNFTQQTGLDDLYNLSNTTFIVDPDFDFGSSSGVPVFTTLNYVSNNEYKLGYWPQDNTNMGGNTTRIYDTKWADYLNDLYNRNARDITAYVDLSGLGDANTIMRNIYSWRSHLWVITKLENFKIAETTQNKFTKVTMHKINNINNWTN